MRRLLIILTSLLTLAVNIYGQAVYTTVTATLTDSSNQVWANATVIASLRPAPNNPAIPLNNGTAITDSPQTVVADNTGTFTLVLDSTNKITPAGALWIFNIYPNATVQRGNSISLAITGTTLNLSGVLSSILSVPSVSAAPVISRAYSNTEVIGGTGAVYWDVTANALKGCTTVVNGLCTAWSTIGNFSVPGSQYYIPYNDGTNAFNANINLQFNYNTNTFSTVNGNYSGNVGITGTLNVDGSVNLFNTLISGTLGVTGDTSIGGKINSNTGFTISGLAPLNHVLLGDGTIYKDSANIPYSIITGGPPVTIYYQTIKANGTAQTQRPVLNFSNRFLVTDSSTFPFIWTNINLNSPGTGSLVATYGSAPTTSTKPAVFDGNGNIIPGVAATNNYIVGANAGQIIMGGNVSGGGGSFSASFSHTLSGAPVSCQATGVGGSVNIATCTTTGMTGNTSGVTTVYWLVMGPY